MYGEGDYEGRTGQEDVGTWAGDESMITKTKPTEGMFDVTEDYYFQKEK